MSVNYNCVDDFVIRWTVKIVSVSFFGLILLLQVIYLNEHISLGKTRYRDDGLICLGYDSFDLEKGFLLVPEFVWFDNYLGKVNAFFLKKR